MAKRLKRDVLDSIPHLNEYIQRSDGITPHGTTKQLKSSVYDSMPYLKQYTQPTISIDDIGPVKKRKWYDGYFQKGLLEDGWQFGDLTRSLVGTMADLSTDATAGAMGIVENTIDNGASLLSLLPWWKDELSEFVAKDIIDEQGIVKEIDPFNLLQQGRLKSGIISSVEDLVKWRDTLQNEGSDAFRKQYMEDLGIDGSESKAELVLKAINYLMGSKGSFDFEKTSVLGEESDSLAQSGGQLATQFALQGVGVPWWVTSAVSSYGSQAEQAFQEGATVGEANVSALISAGAEVLIEKFFGGFEFQGKALSDGVSDIISRGVSNKLLKGLIKFGMDAGGESIEEVFSEAASRFGQWLTYQDDKTISEMLFSEEAFDAYIKAAIGGGLLGGGNTAISIGSNAIAGRDPVSGLNSAEEQVVRDLFDSRVADAESDGNKLSEFKKNKIWDEIVDQMDRGEIAIDDIERILGGDTYKTYQDTVSKEDAIWDEYKTLHKMERGKMTGEQLDRESELKKLTEELDKSTTRSDLANQLKSEVFSVAKDSRLMESYNERVKRGQAFEADVSKYSESERKTIQNAIDSGILNNTRKTHEFVDWVAKVAGAKGLDFKFTNNENLRGTQFEVITEDGKTRFANGYRQGNTIGINTNSKKNVNVVAGHEITHVLEGTELYQALQDAVFRYAVAKDGQAKFDQRLKEVENLYKGVTEDAKGELTADLVGEYLFTDKDFIKRLTTENRNLAQKVFDEIKHMWKWATAGSREKRELERVKKKFERAFREVGKETKKSKSDVQHSLSEEYSDSIDSNGTVLTKAQEDYFGEHGIKDENGNLLTLYRSADGGRTVWDGRGSGSTAQGIYLTDDVYIARAFASDGKNVRDVLEVYARAENPLIIDAEGNNYMDIPMPENAPEWLKDSGDWEGRLNADQLPIDAFANGHDAVIIRNVREGVGGGPATDVILRDSNQMKRTDNTKPTSDPDIRFSLSESVEETRDLIALHNLTEDKLLKSLELGGMPMPSLAVTKADIPHSNFGEITLIFGKETIDPKASKKNKIYSADAWTPVFPGVEYEADSEVGSRISKRLRGLESKIDDYFRRDLRRVGYDFEDRLNRYGGEGGLIQGVLDNYGLKAAYLEEQGVHIDKVTKQEKAPLEYNPDSTDKYEKIMDILGVTTADEMGEVNLKDARDNHGEELEAVYPGITKTAMRMGRYFGIIKSYIEGKDTGPVYNTVTDPDATRRAVDEALDTEGYEAWVRNLFAGIEKDSGIYNNKPIFTPSGNRRSFKQTHLPVTLENIVKAMASQNDGKSKNVSGFNGVKTLRASTAETFKSIDQMRQRKGRLQNLTEEQFAEVTEELQNRLFKVIETIDNESGNLGLDNSFMRFDSIGEILTEIGEAGKFTESYIKSVFNGYSRNISDETATEVKQLLSDVAQMPVNLFEAKPERVVGFDEAKVFVIPYDADVKLKRELLNRGYSIAEYDPKVDGDRHRVVNQFEEYQFSLPSANDTSVTQGNYHVSGKDISLDTPYSLDDIAPVAPKKTINIVKDSRFVPGAKKNDGIWSWAKEHLLDNGMVFEDLAKKSNNRELEAKWNFIRNAPSAANHLLVNGDKKNGIKALKSIIDEVDKAGKTDSFNDYLLHFHNIDRMSLESRFPDSFNKPVFGDRVTAEQSMARVEELEKANPEFKAWAREVYAYNDFLRGKLVDAGIITQETSDLWADMYPHYVPIYRDGEDGFSIDDSIHLGINAPVKRATGGNSKMLNVLDAMASRTLQTFKAVAKNNFGVELMNTLGSVVEHNEAHMDEFTGSFDMDSMFSRNGGIPTYTVYNNGERATFEITEEMYEAMKPKKGITQKKIPVLSHINSIFRGLTTQYNPVFALTNPIKDIQEVLLNSQHPGKTYGNIGRAINEMATKGEYYQEYLANGGQSNTYFDDETKTFKEEPKAKQFLDKVFAFNEYIEMTPRLAEYIASRESGKGIEESMLDAARVTTNFSAGGDVTKFLNRNGATFLNASVQGAIQQVRNVREANQKGLMGYVGLATRWAIGGLAPVLLNNLMWDDDDDYEDLADYVKQDYYIIGKYGDGKFIRIPKGRALAVLQEAMDIVMDTATGDDEVDLARYLALGKMAIENIAPNNPMDNNIFAPIKQVATNKTWYGEDLVPSRLADLPNAEQYDEKIDSISKWLGETFNLSPYKINYLLNQYSGGIGDFFLPMLTPRAESGDDSLLGAFTAPYRDKFTTDSVLNSQTVSDFYDTCDELERRANSKDATEDDAFKYMYMRSISFDTSDLYAQKREIQSSDLPDSEKYERTREIQAQINALMEEALGSYENPHIEGVYAEVGSKRFNHDEESGNWYPIRETNADGSPNWYYQMEQEVTKGLGISYGEYWNNREEYNFAYQKPGKYAIAQSVGGYQDYLGYSDAMYDIHADKDENGKSLNGTRKRKIIEYVNGLDCEYGMKIILYKSEYPSDDSYNYDIIEYLNSRDDISYEQMETILKELGFNVSSDGRITW